MGKSTRSSIGPEHSSSERGVEGSSPSGCAQNLKLKKGGENMGKETLMKKLIDEKGYEVLKDEKGEFFITDEGVRIELVPGWRTGKIKVEPSRNYGPGSRADDHE